MIEASQPRDPHRSEAAARFDLGRHLWEAGDHTAAIEQWKRCHELQPDNWTYKRQAWSLVGNEQIGGGVAGRFNQGPLPGREDEWPFPSSFRDDVAAHGRRRVLPEDDVALLRTRDAGFGRPTDSCAVPSV